MRRSLYNELDVSGTGGPLLVYEYPEPEIWDGEASGIALLVPFQDPSNVGSVIRAAAAFGVKQIVLLGGAAHPFHPKSIRASAGAVFSVSLYEGVEVGGIGKFCADKNIPVVALDARGSDIRTAKLPESFALLPGVEGPGLPEGDFTATISIPIEPAVESLNASTAAAVALFYLTRMR
jgi:tRNA G18 (ribose-2'-O)-methylase SpoU